MANATVTRTFDAQGNCTAVTVAVTYDSLDSPESLTECTKQAAILWAMADRDDEPET